jgi:hypothetical protein
LTLFSRMIRTYCFETNLNGSSARNNPGVT